MEYNYKKLFHLLLEKDLKKADLVSNKVATSNVLSKMTKGEPVSLDSLGKIAVYLECQIGDLVEVIKEVNSND